MEGRQRRGRYHIVRQAVANGGSGDWEGPAADGRQFNPCYTADRCVHVCSFRVCLVCRRRNRPRRLVPRCRHLAPLSAARPVCVYTNWWPSSSCCACPRSSHWPVWLCGTLGWFTAERRASSHIPTDRRPDDNASSGWCVSVCLSVCHMSHAVDSLRRDEHWVTYQQTGGRTTTQAGTGACLSVCLSQVTRGWFTAGRRALSHIPTDRRPDNNASWDWCVSVCLSVCHMSHTDYSTLNHTPRQRKRGLINFHTQYWVWVLTRLVRVCLSVCLSQYFLVWVLTRCHLQHYCVFCDQLLTLLSVWNEDQMVCMYVVWPNTAAVRKPNPFWVLMRQEMMGYADEWFSEWSNLMNEWYLCGTSLRTLTWKKGW